MRVGIVWALLLGWASVSFASIPYPPERPMPEWGVADPRPPSISQSGKPPPTEAGARAQAIQSLFADPGVDVYDLRLRYENGGVRLRSLTDSDLSRARAVVGETELRERQAVGPWFCRKPRSAAEVVLCVRSRLAAEPSAFVDRLRIRFEEKSGTLFLEGRAYHLLAKKVSERAAFSVGGVKHVSNRLDAAPSVPRDDRRMREELLQRLAIREDLRSENAYRVEVERGVARLWGMVGNEGAKELLRSLAEQVRGIIEVHDEIVVRPLGSDIEPMPR